MQLIKLEALTANFIHSYSSVSCLLNKNKNDCISTKSLYIHYAQCEATESHFASSQSLSSHHFRASSKNSLSQKRQQQKNEVNDDDKEQQQMNDMTAEVMIEKVDATLSDESLRLTEQLQLLSLCNTSSELSHDEVRRCRDGDSDSEFDKRFNSDNNNRKSHHSRLK